MSQQVNVGNAVPHYTRLFSGRIKFEIRNPNFEIEMLPHSGTLWVFVIPQFEISQSCPANMCVAVRLAEATP